MRFDSSTSRAKAPYRSGSSSPSASSRAARSPTAGEGAPGRLRLLRVDPERAAVALQLLDVDHRQPVRREDLRTVVSEK